jgi:hypothetical protein
MAALLAAPLPWHGAYLGQMHVAAAEAERKTGPGSYASIVFTESYVSILGWTPFLIEETVSSFLLFSLQLIY